MKPSRQKLKRNNPSILVIFGFSGDLTRRYLLPALYHLERHGLLKDIAMIYGVAGRKIDKQAVKDLILDSVKNNRTAVDKQVVKSLQSKITYESANFNQQEDLKNLMKAIERQEKKLGICTTRLFYFSVPASMHLRLAENLNACGFLEGCRDDSRELRVIVEKPFGHDLASAKRLNDKLLRYFTEDEIYRIDHYLGKETVQNLFVTRFANSIFEPIWNHKYIDHVQITVSEELGVGSRGKSYEETGALRDIIQNHALQVLSMVAMEQPAQNRSIYIQDEKIKVLRTLRRMDAKSALENVVRAQYAPGRINNKRVVGYLDEVNVSKRSKTETYVAMKVFIDNERWHNVPFYLRTGKRLPQKVSEISIHFKDAPQYLYKNTKPNVLIFRIQPDEGIFFEFTSKRPGFGANLANTSMEMGFNKSFDGEMPDAYERLLLDWIQGSKALFIRTDGLYESWDFTTKILKSWAKQEGPLPAYKAGTWGPKEANELMSKDGRVWRLGS